ncbi:MAG: hypothetical protein CMJ49_12980 [Planctomycetaceae bacterium]|nr:hypothetical protein [Planctomycetaceae bacterium]
MSATARIIVLIVLLLPAFAQGVTIDFWLADGNNSADGTFLGEDRLVRYNSQTGIALSTDTIRAIHLPTPHWYGWPSDLIRIAPPEDPNNPVVIGVDTFWQQIYTLDDPNTGHITPIPDATGNRFGSYAGLGSLAYDSDGDILYSMDGAYGLGVDRLITFNRTTGAKSTAFNVGFTDVRGMAFNEADDLLYVYDKDLGQIHTLDPNSQATQLVTTPVHDVAGGFYGELTFFGGDLFAPFRYEDALGADVVQVREIDLLTGAIVNIGEPIFDVSAHSLLMNSYNPGDVNDDGVVDVGDLAVVGAQWGGPGGTPNGDVAPLLGGDGVVDVADLAMVGANWGGGVGPAVHGDGVMVPGPAAGVGVWALLAGTWVGGGRRRA